MNTVKYKTNFIILNFLCSENTFQLSKAEVHENCSAIES